MANLSIKVSDFEGPLDLLMHLIERDKIDIYDIPIVSITEQYISYLREMSEFDMEVAAITKNSLATSISNSLISRK